MLLRSVVGLGVYYLVLIGLFQAEMVSDNLFQILEQYPPLVVVLGAVYYLQKIQREDIRERRRQHVEDNKERRRQQVEDNAEAREWLEKMLEFQRTSLRDIYTGQQAFITALLSQIDDKQNIMVERIEILAQQIAINTSTVGEIAKVDSIVSELIARLEKK